MMHSIGFVRKTLAEQDRAKTSLEEKLRTAEEEVKATSKKAEEDKVRLKADLNKAWRRIKSLE